MVGIPYARPTLTKTVKSCRSSVLNPGDVVVYHITLNAGSTPLVGELADDVWPEDLEIVGAVAYLDGEQPAAVELPYVVDMPPAETLNVEVSVQLSTEATTTASFCNVAVYTDETGDVVEARAGLIAWGDVPSLPFKPSNTPGSEMASIGQSVETIVNMLICNGSLAEQCRLLDFVNAGGSLGELIADIAAMRELVAAFTKNDLAEAIQDADLDGDGDIGVVPVAEPEPEPETPATPAKRARKKTASKGE